MSVKALLAAAAVMVIALTPSVADCVSIHEDKPQYRWVLYLWIALALAIAVAWGESMMGKR